MNGALHRLIQVAERIAIIANATGTLVVLGLVVVVNYDVVSREAFHSPFNGAYELVQFSVVLIVFLQLPDVVRVNRLTRSDGFLSIAGDRWPLIASVLNRIINTIACIFMGLVAIAIWPEFLEMLETRDFFGVPGIFTAPWWPIKLAIFISSALCALLFALKVLVPKPAASTTANVDTGVDGSDVVKKDGNGPGGIIS